MNRLVTATEQSILFLQRRTVGIKVPETPHFDTTESTAWFVDKLQRARRYLEYGTGGSTFVAAKLGKDFVAVESDPHYLGSVRRTIDDHGYNRSRQVFRYADIGRIGQWGRPRGAVSQRRLEQFRRYSDPPAECFQGELPDLVLVDGRFRIACALKALKMLRNETGWRIVVDDYVGRPEYRVIEDCARMETVGRMAVLTAATPDVDLEQTIRHWETYSE